MNLYQEVFHLYIYVYTYIFRKNERTGSKMAIKIFYLQSNDLCMASMQSRKSMFIWELSDECLINYIRSLYIAMSVSQACRLWLSVSEV